MYRGKTKESAEMFLQPSLTKNTILLICINPRYAEYRVVKNMRKTLDLSEYVMQKAMSLTYLKTKKQVITYALQELIKESKLTGLKKSKGKIDLNIDHI